MSSSAADHEAKLALYEQQLAQVEKLLTADPSNAEYLKLRRDIEEVRSLTLNLLGRPVVASLLPPMRRRQTTAADL